ncbi:MAG: transglycosylase SLT domain-containing protein [Gemmatimonadota bacterium]
MWSSILRRGPEWPPTIHAAGAEVLARERSRRRIRRLLSWAGVLGLNSVALFALFAMTGDGLAGALGDARYTSERLSGEKALLALQVERFEAVHRYSARYGIPADLAASVYDIALAEGLAPDTAFRLVEIESSFRQRAVSEAGAIGYTQIKPSTARSLDPSVTERDLFERETNLRLGFRYLRQLLEQFDGDMRLALLAYNRGPSRLEALLQMGRDPANGYARVVLGGGE